MPTEPMTPERLEEIWQAHMDGSYWVHRYLPDLLSHIERQAREIERLTALLREGQ